MLDAINTNIISLSTQNNLANSQSSLATTIQRLSSGLKINSAADDPAGLAISDRMTSQVNGLNQATQNASNAIALTQTADGGLASTTSLLQTMRTLAVEAANGTNSTSDRQSLQTEIAQLQQQIGQVSQTTQYNGINLLDGSLSNVQFQVGANAGQTISFNIGSSAANAIGNNTLAPTAATAATTLSQAHLSGTAAAVDANVLAAQTITISGNGTSASIGLTAGESGYATAAAVNAAAGTTGVKATATSNATLSNFGTGLTVLTLQGAPTATGAANPITVSSTLATSKDLTDLTTNINAQSGSTGITAVADLVNGTISLTQADGYDIGVTNATNSTQAALEVTGTTSAGAAGTAVTLAAAGSVGDTATVGALVSFSAASSFSVSTDTATSGIFDATTSSGSTLSSVAGIDVTKLTNGLPSGANDALAVIDAALANVDTARASLGALQNRFTASISNLQTSTLNITSARSTVLDTNFAAETANLSRGQILQQAGTAMLAQANSLPNGVLALLR